MFFCVSYGLLKEWNANIAGENETDGHETGGELGWHVLGGRIRNIKKNCFLVHINIIFKEVFFKFIKENSKQKFIKFLKIF